MNVDKELERLLNGREKYGQLRGRQATADDYVKGVYAMLYDSAPDGSVAEKDAWIKRQEKYRIAIQEKENRYAEWEAARIYAQVVFAANEKYRTDKATERNMMRASQ